MIDFKRNDPTLVPSASDSSHMQMYFDLDGRPRRKNNSGVSVLMGYTMSGNYDDRPAAAIEYNEMYYLAVNIGLDGVLFRCYNVSGSTYAWKQIGSARLAVNTSNKVFNSGATSGSIFNSAPSLPNGCLAIGTRFDWEMREVIVDSGSDDAACVYKTLIGSTDVGNLTFAAFGEYNRSHAELRGSITVRTLGASGTIMGTFDERWTHATTSTGTNFQDSTTAATVDTTGAVSPDVTITLSSFTNNGSRTVIAASMLVSGLV